MTHKETITLALFDIVHHFYSLYQQSNGKWDWTCQVSGQQPSLQWTDDQWAYWYRLTR